MEPPPHNSEHHVARRRRARYTVVACYECRRRKTKCSGDEPCTSCIFHEIPCSYVRQDEKEPRKKTIRKPSATRHDTGKRPSLSGNGPRSPTTNSRLQDRFRRLEQEILALKSEVPRVSSHGQDHDHDDTSPMTVDEGTIRSDHSASTGFCLCGRKLPPTAPPDADAHIASLDDESQGRTSQYVSLAMQVRTLKEAVPSPDWPDPTTPRSTDLETFLAPSPRLWYLLDLFFAEYNFYLLVVDCTAFLARLEKLFDENASARPQQLLIRNAEPDQVSLVALTCMILAKAEQLSSEYNTDTTPHKPHQAWHAESCRVMAQSYVCRPANFDLVQLRLLESFYMISLERIDRFSACVIDAVNEACAAGLNDQSTWKNCTKSEFASRRALWWTTYLMDRQAAQRYGRPYLLRDMDFVVDDFSAELKRNLSTDRSVAVPFVSHVSLEAQVKGRSNTDAPAPPSDGGPPSYLTESEWYHYLQFIATIGHLVTRAYDSFYCCRAPKAGDYEETESIDALLLRAKRNLCPTLTWCGNFSPAEVSTPRAADQIMRLQIIIFLRINILRLSIRRHLWKPRKDHHLDVSWHDNEFLHTVRMCRLLAVETIDAISEYVTHMHSTTFGPFSTMSLIECIYNLVALPMTFYVTPDNPCEKVTSDITRAVHCIQALAQMKIKFAQKAYRMLHGFLQPGICALHRTENSGAHCTLQQMNDASGDIFATDAFQMSGLEEFSLGDETFRLPSSGPHFGFDIDDMIAGLNQDAHGWPRGLLA